MTFFDHPLHPMTVHFPIAFYMLGVVLTLGHLWRGRAEWERFAYLSFILSGLTALIASLVGLIDQSQLPVADPRQAAVNNHITAGLALLVINGVLIYMRLRWPDVLQRYRWRYLGLIGAGLLALLSTAWLGAELVYRLRVGLIG